MNMEPGTYPKTNQMRVLPGIVTEGNLRQEDGVQGQPGLYGQTLSQKKKKTQTNEDDVGSDIL